MKLFLLVILLAFCLQSCVLDALNAIIEMTKEEEYKTQPPTPPKTTEIYKDSDMEQGEIFEFPDVEAEFPGGPREMKKWISENIEYPQIAIEKDIEGKVFVGFVIQRDGKITNVYIERSVSYELDLVALQTIRKMPRWRPGKSNGKNVRTKVRLPIAFTLK